MGSRRAARASDARPLRRRPALRGGRRAGAERDFRRDSAGIATTPTLFVAGAPPCPCTLRRPAGDDAGERTRRDREYIPRHQPKGRAERNTWPEVTPVSVRSYGDLVRDRPHGQARSSSRRGRHGPRDRDGRELPRRRHSSADGDVEERMYAAGKMPGSFFKREGRARGEGHTDSAHDRPPAAAALPKGWRYETRRSRSRKGPRPPYDILAMNSAAAALMVSDIPFPDARGRGADRQDRRQLRRRPQQEEERSRNRLDLIVSGTEDEILMVEAGGQPRRRSSTRWTSPTTSRRCARSSASWPPGKPKVEVDEKCSSRRRPPARRRSRRHPGGGQARAPERLQARRRGGRRGRGLQGEARRSRDGFRQSSRRRSSAAESRSRRSGAGRARSARSRSRSASPARTARRFTRGQSAISGSPGAESHKEGDGSRHARSDDQGYSAPQLPAVLGRGKSRVHARPDGDIGHGAGAGANNPQHGRVPPTT